ncbi:MAG: hypothetical protein J6A21_07950 [Lentisphaeria bacterium]|nr:hypothetical protein [Lentisphaeria bacterium]
MTPEQLKLDPFEYEIPAEATMNEVKDRRNVLETNVFQLVRMGDRFFYKYQFGQAYDAYVRALDVFDRQKLGSGKYLETVKARIRKRIDAAHKAWAEAVFTGARKRYTAALSKGPTQEAIEEYEKARTAAYSAFAVYYFKDPKKSFDKKLMSSIAARDPKFYNRINAFLEDCTKMVAAVNFQIDTSLETIDPDNRRRKQEIDQRLKNARIYYRQKEYEKVRENVEKILVLDPYNEPAITLLEKTYQRLYKVAAYRRQVDAEEKITDVDWKWVEPFPPDGEKLTPVEGENSKGMEDKAEEADPSKNNTALYNKLQQLIMPQLEYTQETIGNIVTDLVSRSKDADNVKHEGVVIVPEADVKDIVINSLALNNVSLHVWLKYICRLGKVNFRLDGNYVIIGKGGRAVEAHDYPISQTFAQRIQEELGEAKKVDDEEEKFDGELEDFTAKRDKKKDSKKVNRTIDPEKLKGYFRERGVPFPEGTSISYDGESGRLKMRNTKENHDKLMDRIQVLDVPVPLVMVEAKMMEISMSAMEELGFDWTLTFDASVNNRRFISTSTFPFGQIYSRASDTSNILVNNLNLIPNAGGSRNVNLFLTIRAIDRSERSEVVTMPRLTTLSNHTALLKVVDERSFPDDYDDAKVEVNSNGNTFTYTPPTPDFKVQSVGMTFKVTPTVINMKTVDVSLNTSLKKFIGWSNYDYTIKIGKAFESIADTSTENIQPKEKMADFAERRIETQVQVYDGESVVIGGVLQDGAEKVDDKYPLLGELPLIGRLFTDRYNSSEKINLMIFVTARIMDGDGVPYKTERRKDGIFNFVNR